MNPTILIVDDDFVFRTRLAQAFGERGFSTMLAGDFNQALSLAKSQPQFGVFDLKIPGGSGLTLLPEFKKIAPECKIVLLTGYATFSTAVQAVKEGAVNYLAKPTHADAILQALLGAGEATRTSSLPLPTLDQVEWDHIQRVLSDCEGNISKASKVLGLHRRSLQRKLAKFPDKLQ